MKRRSVIQSMLGLSAAAAMPAPLMPQQAQPPARVINETPATPVVTPDAAAAPQVRFFSPVEFAVLQRLGEILVPVYQRKPGAAEARAAEFLDFLIGASEAGRQQLYRDGLAHLDHEARRLHSKPFAELSAALAEPILAPLKQPWTYPGPADRFARFLSAAKDDFLQATVNSQQWAEAASGRRAASGMGLYWYPIE